MINGNFISNYLIELRETAGNMPVEDIDKTIEMIYEAWETGNQIFICGNGGSASTATECCRPQPSPKLRRAST